MEGILKNWSKIKLVIMKDWSENIDALFHLFGKVRDEWMDKDLTTWTGANRSEALSYGQSIYTQMTPILLLVTAFPLHLLFRLLFMSCVPQSRYYLRKIAQKSHSLNMRSKALRGSLSPYIGNLSFLREINLENNTIQGEIPREFGRLLRLEALFLSNNSLAGKIPANLSYCSRLTVLALPYNKLVGRIPFEFVSLYKLKRLALHRNSLTGGIPPFLGNLSSLELLSLGANSFGGNIPDSLGQLKELEALGIGGNNLSGTIPHSIYNLSFVEIFSVPQNQLHGSLPTSLGVIPSSLGNLKRLAYLEMFENDLSGTIPEAIFSISYLSNSLNLAENHFVGSIPPRIGNLKALRSFDVSNNGLSGEIPIELGLCSSLEDIYLGGNFFHGSIPSFFRTSRGIRKLDLSRNNLSGQIPLFLEALSLEYLNLSFNDFEGKVPTKGIFANTSAISVAGIVMVSFFIFSWHKRSRPSRQPSEPMIRKALLKMSYKSLLKATDGFSSTNLIGVGSFGSVYKGVFDEDGTVVAIKVINLQRQGASKSFMAECKALKNIRHKNLVRVITSCSGVDFQGNDFKAIVYKYMPNGSLENWLHPDAIPQRDREIEIQKLTLLQRISIAIDVASALDYLHQHCQEPILHCDLKPSNILLDNDLSAHIGDFGLSRFYQAVSNPTVSSSIGVRGTIGYVAPEYGLGSEVSTNGDVYSYGILLLEMVTTKKPTDVMFEGGLNLHNFARMALPDHVMDIVDPILLNDDEVLVGTDNHGRSQTRTNSTLECLISMLRIGVACSMESPQDRMNITNVVHELQSVKNILLEPKTMFNKQTDN
ncbi:putative LRR receptor-like serine/threonine-protein kinase [Citrus sinensis]|uniref:LRR receptor-like serine/threonine-protein kinase n=1 Tax=Citrus sinensis TaxID=2711 RepID=A0ACB8JQ63_CITSI|nr:putative LRR receptor-like serine/threonine-protein kinase [Citrus sinensis]